MIISSREAPFRQFVVCFLAMGVFAVAGCGSPSHTPSIAQQFFPVQSAAVVEDVCSTAVEALTIARQEQSISNIANLVEHIRRVTRENATRDDSQSLVLLYAVSSLGDAWDNAVRLQGTENGRAANGNVVLMLDKLVTTCQQL